MPSLISLAIGLLPVLTFLVCLVAFDSYKLVRFRSILQILAIGAVVATLSAVVHTAARQGFDMDGRILARYLAPIVEEGLKGLVIVALLRHNRVGFLVDAAIFGFATGAGFAVVENVQYFLALEDTRLVLWVIRGFGTAVMHGGVTAMMAVISKRLVDQHGKEHIWAYLPGLAVAIVIHSLFNHFFLSPDKSAIILLVVLPIVMAGIFRSSERATREWLGVGFDTDCQLLETIRTGHITTSPIGRYLASLRERFPAEVIVDMLCFIRLHLELSVKAKAILLAREAGFDLDPDQQTIERIDELRFLEKSIGPIGRLALSPIFNMSSRDLWEFYRLAS